MLRKPGTRYRPPVKEVRKIGPFLTPPVSAYFGLLQAKLTVASAFGNPSPPLVRTSFIDEPL